MNTDAVTAFLDLAHRDAALQERVVEASKQPDPLDALVKVAASAGFAFTAEELQGAFSSELTEEQLDNVAAGYQFRAPGEWFAECYAAYLKRE